MNRRLAYLDKINPDVAVIRKSYPTNIERGWGYIKLLLQKLDLENSEVEIWLNSKYHILEEQEIIQSMDSRPTIMQIMKPLTENTLNEKINELKLWLNL
jgi:hypothetical protein